MTVILVKGITGSGKTYALSKLSKITTTIDTDDLYYNEYNKKPRPMKQIHKQVIKILQNVIKRNKFVVITGNDMPEIKYDYIYFIKLTNVAQAYKRLVVRELTKFRQISVPNIQDMNAKDVNLFLRMTYKAGIDPLGITFNEYKEKYEQKLKKQDPSTIIKTQAQIIDDIIKKLNI